MMWYGSALAVVRPAKHIRLIWGIYLFQPNGNGSAQTDDQAKQQEMTVSIVYQDEIIGGIQLLSGEPSFYNVKTRIRTSLAVIKDTDFYTLV